MAPVNDLVADGSPAAKEAKQKPLAGGNNSAVIVLWYSKMLDLDLVMFPKSLVVRAAGKARPSCRTSFGDELT